MAKTGKGDGKETIGLGQLIEEVTVQSCENLMIFMQICDIINSSTDGPKEAAKSIRKRFAIKDPLVINHTLSLLETCGKNCGARFHVQIANRDFLRDFLKIINPKNNPSMEIQMMVLGLLQKWAFAFQGFPELKEVCKTYQDLKNKNVEFPPADGEQLSLTDIPRKNSTATDQDLSSHKFQCLSPTGVEHSNQHRRLSSPQLQVDRVSPTQNVVSYEFNCLSPTGNAHHKTSGNQLGRPTSPMPGLLSPNPPAISYEFTRLSPTGASKPVHPKSPLNVRKNQAGLSPTGTVHPKSPAKVRKNQPAPIKNQPAVSDSSTQSRTSPLWSEVTTIKQNCQIFVETMCMLTPEKGKHSDQELVEDLNLTCRQMQKRVVQLLETSDDDKLTAELLLVNDELNGAFICYEQLKKSNSQMKGEAPEKFSQNKVIQEVMTSSGDANVADLIDFDESGVGLSSDLNNQLNDMSLGGSRVKSLQSSSAEATHDPIRFDRVQEFAEMEKWVLENEGSRGQSESSDFDRYLKSRVQQISSTSSKSTHHS